MKLTRALFILSLVVGGLASSRASAQISPEQAAEMVLNSARKAANEKNYPFAVGRYKEFLAKFGGHKEAVSARFGLGVALLNLPERPYQEARDSLQAAANDRNFADHAQAKYFLAVAVRGLGMKELAEGSAKPNEMPQRRDAAQRRFEEAQPFFAAALTEFTSQAKNAKPAEKDLPIELEWVARARCDLAELQLRTKKTKEARDTASPFVSDPILSRSKYRDQGRYYFGYASLLLHDPVAAQKTLSLLAPFTDPAFGGHARYLLARTHHLEDERSEAATHYAGTIADYQRSKEGAANLLKLPEALKADPEERVRLEGLARHPAPDYVGRAQFYLAVLQYEAGKFGDAKGRFQELLKQVPNTPFRNEAELRIGFCQVQLKEYPEALKTLAPLVDRDPKLADQVVFWMGKAQAGAAPAAGANAQGHQQAMVNAINTVRQAIDRTAPAVATRDPEALTRRGEMQLELADMLQGIKQFRDAATTYQKLLDDMTLPERQEELTQRLAAAWTLTPEYNESDKVCERFQQKFPQSTLMPAVLFTCAENAYFRAAALEKMNPAQKAELAKLREETVARFKKVIEKYPEYAKINSARYSLGLTYYQQGDLEKALKAFGDIPAPDRNGEIALASYLSADCLLRQMPREIGEDALAAGKLEEQLKGAAELLESFVNGQPKHPQAPDALLKFGFTQQRMAALLAQPPEKAKVLAAATATYERIIRDYPNDPAFAQAALEAAKCRALAGDVNGAVQRLQGFQSNPRLKTSAIAPMAMIDLAMFLRTMNRHEEAVQTMAKAREQYEGPLNADPERNGWVHLLRYHHALALRETGKLTEARALFEQVRNQAGDRPEAIEEALRMGQCLKDEGMKKLELGRKLKSSGRKEDIAPALKATEEGMGLLRSAVDQLTNSVNALKKTETLPEARARMLYESAWALRTLAEPEVDAARTQMAKEKQGPAGAKLPLPEIPLEKVPLQPSEKRVREVYKSLVDDFSDLPIATEARFELAELLAQRHEIDKAAQLLNDVLDKEPGPELTEKVRLRLGAVHAAKGNLKAALTQFDAVAANPKSTLAGWAHYQAGEALLQQRQVPEAIKRLALIRDQGQWHNVPGLTDRALLRLGQAYGQEKNWDLSRQAYERLVGAFPTSRWVGDARYGIGWAYQQQNNHEGAVQFYNQVTAHTVEEVGAKAQLQIGLCRLEQKRFQDAANALMVVPLTYDYPELSAAALMEASRAYTLMTGQEEQVRRVLERLVRDYPDTPWGDEAREQLGKKNK